MVSDYIEFLELKLGKEYASSISAKLSKYKFTNLTYKELFITLFDIPSIDHHRSTDKVILVEKTPSHIYQIDQIANVIPEAHFIYIYRHPVFVIKSHIRHFSNKFQLLKYNRTCRSWNKAQEIAEQYINRGSCKLITVFYEDIIAHPSLAIGSIFSQLNLTFDKNSLDTFMDIIPNIVTSKEHWKSENSKEIRTKEHVLSFVDYLMPQLYVIQYHTYKIQKKRGLKIYAKFFQLFIFNPMYYLIDSSLHGLSVIKSKIISS